MLDGWSPVKECLPSLRANITTLISCPNLEGPTTKTVTVDKYSGNYVQQKNCNYNSPLLTLTLILQSIMKIRR